MRRVLRDAFLIRPAIRRRVGEPEPKPAIARDSKSGNGHRRWFGSRCGQRERDMLVLNPVLVSSRCKSQGPSLIDVHLECPNREEKTAESQ